MAQKPLTKKQIVIWCFALALVFICAAAFAMPRVFSKEKRQVFPVVAYEGPEPLEPLEGVGISVNDTPLFVYNMPVNNSHSWVNAGDPPVAYCPMAYYDCDGRAKVTITLDEAVESTVVRPLSAEIKPKIEGNTVSFYVEKPGQYVAEFNGSVVNAAHLFVNPVETDVPDVNDENVRYIGPGLWDIGSISLKSGQTLYIAGGAVVYGAVQAKEAENVTVCGRGILDGSIYESWTHKNTVARVPINLTSCKNASVEGVILLNPNAWAVSALSCEDSFIDNIKIVTSRQNGDGISLQSCKGFTVSGSFVRSWDDSLVIKNYEGSSDGVTFRNMVLWTDLAQSMEVGYETNKGLWPKVEIRNILFENITVLHNFHKPVMSIHNGDDATVKDVIFRNVTVEDAQMGRGDAGENNQLIEVNIASTTWSSTRARGQVMDILFENIAVLGGNVPPIRIMGYDDEHKVENVTVRNLSILGQPVTSLDDITYQSNLFVSGVNVEVQP
ncbi:MAG TPA: glycosyl hydrolase family 28 protein [Clostridia bacterium]|nr:glycosyl hydrolase family 28 protein [Clostridia bacterium]